MLLFIMLSLLFLLWGMAGRKGTFDIEEEISSTGSLIRRVMKSTKTANPTRDVSTMGSRALEHKREVRSALNRGSKKRRR